MTVSAIKKRIEDEVNSHHYISQSIKPKSTKKRNLRNTKVFSKILKCKKRDLYMYLRQFEWIRKVYMYINKIIQGIL